MRIIILSTLLAAVIYISNPATTQAFTVIDNGAVSFSANEALHYITFTVRFANRDVYLPLTAGEKKISYSLIPDTSIPSPITAQAGLLLSDLSLHTNGYYYLPTEETATFTFVSLVTTAGGNAAEEYDLEITTLPYITEKDGVLRQNQVLASQLKSFTTAE